MVGVAGKSQACNTCRSRRVKCDLGRPACLKCINSDRECTGYGRELIFVNRTSTDQSSTALSVLCKSKAQQKSTEPPSVLQLSLLDQEARLHDLFHHSAENSQQFRKHAVVILQSTYVPKEGSSIKYEATIAEGSFSWVHRLTDLDQPSSSLDTSIFAFCLAQLYATRLGNASFDQCLDHYNNALQHLRNDLNDPDRSLREETLAAILVLSTCELFIYSSGDAWGFHLGGLIEILRMRSPEMANTPAWRDLLSRFRVVCIVQALTSRKAQILDDDIWMQIMAQRGMSNGLHQIFQMLLGVPSVLEMVVATSEITDLAALSSKVSTSINQLLTLARSFKSWLEDFWKASDTPRAWLIPSRATNPVDADAYQKTFPECFEFESIQIAIPVIMCWAVLVQLYSNIIQLHDLLQQRLGRHIDLESVVGPGENNLSSLANSVSDLHQSNFHSAVSSGVLKQAIEDEGATLARQVCQSLEYCHRVEMGTYGSQATTYPSWSARQWFRLHPGHEREGLWLRNMHRMSGSGMRWGVSTMRFADIKETLTKSAVDVSDRF